MSSISFNKGLFRLTIQNNCQIIKMIPPFNCVQRWFSLETFTPCYFISLQKHPSSSHLFYPFYSFYNFFLNSFAPSIHFFFSSLSRFSSLVSCIGFVFKHNLQFSFFFLSHVVLILLSFFLNWWDSTKAISYLIISYPNSILNFIYY